MYITYELLEEKRAYKEMIEWFKEHFPDGCEFNDETINKFANAPTGFIWWFYDKVQQDKRLYKLCGVIGSDGVIWSNKINHSNGVNYSDRVRSSNGVNYSNGVNWSAGVSCSNGVDISHGVSGSFGIKNSHGVNNALFLANKPETYSIFGKDVSKQHFYEVKENLYKNLNGWKPIFPDESNNKEVWLGMPQEAIDYVKSLEEFDAEMFTIITGIE